MKNPPRSRGQSETAAGLTQKRRIAGSDNRFRWYYARQKRCGGDNKIDRSYVAKSATIPTMRRACVIALLPLLLASARADDKPDLQKIIDAWKAREKAIQSFDFRWWSKRHESRDTNPPVDSPVIVPQHVVPGNVIAKPENDSIWRCRFLADSGGRYLVEEFGHEWISDKGDFVPRHTVIIFDGKSYKYFFDTGRFDYPLWRVTEIPPGVDPDHKWPDLIKVAFRPSSLVLGTFHPQNLALTNKTATFDDNCIRVRGDENRCGLG